MSSHKPESSNHGHKPKYPPRGFGDNVALFFVKFLRIFADAFFSDRYGHRAIVLETVAAVPGMVGGSMLHLKSLRKMREDHGWIVTLLDEAENERMHLMTFVELVKPTSLERALVIVAQVLFYLWYALIYIISSRVAHRIVGYLEEEAVVSYTLYLEKIDNGSIENVPAPRVAIDYWDLPQDVRLRDVVVAIRNDEMRHQEVNHCMADKLGNRPCRAPDDHLRVKDKERLQGYIRRESP